MLSSPITQDLLLIGGGHSHAIALRQWGMRPLPGVRITLLTETSDTPYSGMLPGHVAGFYDREACHINLRSLCEFAGAQLLIDRVIGLDLVNHQALCHQRPPVAFDLVSIDVGSTPLTPLLPSELGSSVMAKPVPQFLHWWNELCERLPSGDRPFVLGIIGGGAGGVELALTMHQRLRAIGRPFTLHLFQRTAVLLPRHNAWVQQRFYQLLTERGIQIHLQEPVQAVQAGQIICASGLTIACDESVWVTQATAPGWLRAAGLAVTAAGFVQVNDYLQSVSHPPVFAAGDVATMVNYDRPKAGVFAVRQGPPLVKNLQNALLQKPLQPYRPQAQFLSLIGTGDGAAVASRGRWGWQSRLLWQWKDRIDRGFMRKFSHLPEMPNERDGQPTDRDAMPCRGCGAKVGSTTLENVLHRLRPLSPRTPSALIALDTPDDAAVWQIPAGKLLVQTIDYFPALINDPYVFGQIAANHSLSDLFAMGALPHSALAIATVPYGTAAKQEEILYQVLAGAMQVLQAAQAELIGGHTIAGETLAFGLSCNGLTTPDRLLRKGGMLPGQGLILTKPLGTGTLFAAAMRRQAKAIWIDQAIATMLISNQAAAAVFGQYATACTDITGFGLLGHLGEMVRAAAVTVWLDRAAIPILPGARAMVQQGFLSSLHGQNLRAQEWLGDRAEASRHPDDPLLFDPQTAGGLLAAVPLDQVDACLTGLKAVGYADAAMIGRVVPLMPGMAPIAMV